MEQSSARYLEHQTTSTAGLINLLHSLDVMINSSSTAISSDHSFLSQSFAESPRLLHVIESSHPYSAQRTSKAFSFNNASFLILYFDHRSATLHKSDQLLIQGVDSTMKVGGTLIC